MKTNLLIIATVAILVTACTTGTQMTRTYDDDIYFSPKDVPPVSMVQNDASDQKSKSDATNKRIVVSQRERNADGTVTLNNDIYQRDNSDFQVYDLDDQELVESDTTVYYNDDSVKYVINNYYDDEDIDFTYRINRFHRPYFYDPFFYDDWAFGYYPFYSGYYGGYDPWYGSRWGWGYPYGGYYDYYYSPFAFGFGGYLGYSYYNSYYHGYYHGYNNGYYGGGYYDNHDVARRRSTEMNMPNTNRQASMSQQGRSRSSVLKDGSYGNDSDQQLPTGVRSTNSKTFVQNGHTRSRSINATDNNGDTKNATIVNNRRAVNASGSQVENSTRTRTQVAIQGSTTSGTQRRSYEPSTTGRTYDQSRTVRQGQNYTPSYNKPRIVNQSNYNNNSYTRSRTAAPSQGNYDRGVVKSGSTGTPSYSAPRSSSNMRQTYQSRSSYSSGSSNSSPRSSVRSSDYTPSRSYSAPERSSGGSYSGGSSGSSSGGSYSGGSSGSSSGGSSGGGSGHRR